MAETGFCGIENPFPDLKGGIGVPVVGCQKSLIGRMP